MNVFTQEKVQLKNKKQHFHTINQCYQEKL